MSKVILLAKTKHRNIIVYRTLLSYICLRQAREKRVNHFKHAREKHSGDSQRGQHAIDFRFPNPTVGINIVGEGG